MMVASSRRGPMRAAWEKWGGIFVAGMCAVGCAAGQLLLGQEAGNALSVLGTQYSVPSAEKFASKVSAPTSLSEASPVEAIPQSGSIKLKVRRSVLLRTKVDVYRTAIVDDAVCDIVQLTPREVSIIGRAMGQTHVTFWFDDPAMAPLTYLVEVQSDSGQKP